MFCSCYRLLRQQKSTFHAARLLKRRNIHLSYTCVPAVGENQEKPTLVIAHGLFGANQNWRTISKKINQICGNQVICVDLRNHGDSEHHQSMTFEEMGHDIMEVLERRKVKKVSLLGHSLGGKVMMALALSKPSGVEGVVSVDSSPVSYAGNPNNEIGKYIKVMQGIDLSLLASRREVEPQMTDVIKSKLVRQFLLRNVVQSNHGLGWRMNLDSIAKNYTYLMGFPDLEGKKFDKPTLFIGGGKSDYIKEEHKETIHSYFPQAKIKHIPEAGHWVHAERPQEVVRLVCQFLQQ